MGKDHGEPIRHDPDFKGPIHNRSCTDIVWLILFILFLGAWGYVGYYSMTKGSVDKLLAPIDTYGRRCGLDAGLENKKYLVFFDISKCLSPGTPITGCPTKQVCVEQCPTETIFIEKEIQSGGFEQVKSKMVCNDIDPQSLSQSEALQHIQAEKCARYVLKSKPVLQRCVLFSDISEVIQDIQNITGTLDLTVDQVLEQLKKLVQFDQLSSQIVQDLVQSRWYMAGSLVAVVIICFIYILLLRWVVAPVVWTSIVGLIGLLGFALYLCYKQYEYFKEHPVSLTQTTNLKGLFESWFTKSSTWLVIMIIVVVILIILLIVVIFLRSRITIAIALIKEGSKAVTAVKTTVLFPVFPWVLQCAVIAYGVTVLMYLVSIGEPAFRVAWQNDTNCVCTSKYSKQSEGDPCNPAEFAAYCQDAGQKLPPRLCQQATCHFTGIDNPHSVIWLQLVNLLGFYWTWFFVSGVADMMLASTFATWYWTFHKRKLPFFTLTGGILRVLCYHLGTVAFGSLIIAIVAVIRVILEYIDHKLKKFENPLTKCILCLCKCCFWCLETFIKFINKNAYIMCAVHGKGFCASAHDAFSLLMRNIARVVVLDKVMDFVFFLSKLLISIGVGFAVYYLMQWNYVYEITKGERLNYSYIPAIILAIATFLICSIFFNVYAMAVDTLFLCFLEDCERNDGSPEKPYFMSTNLMKILGKKNKRA